MCTKSGLVLQSTAEIWILGMVNQPTLLALKKGWLVLYHGKASSTNNRHISFFNPGKFSRNLIISFRQFLAGMYKQENP